jgi:DNA repair protein RadC
MLASWAGSGKAGMNLDALSNKELLCRVLGESEAEHIYRGELVPLFRTALQPSKSQQTLLAARELMKRALAEEMRGGALLCNPDAVEDYLRLHFLGQEHESLVVLFLDARNRLIVAEELFRGTITGTVVYPREVVRRALYWNAVSVIFSHNHPGGEALPSDADRRLTDCLAEALGHIDVRVLDHFVVAGSAVTSFTTS